MNTISINFDDHPDVPYAVCQESFDQEDIKQQLVTLPCGYNLHTACLACLFVPVGITPWNEDYETRKCPLCHTLLYHLPYKFYTQEMVAEREENLQQELHLYQERETNLSEQGT